MTPKLIHAYFKAKPGSGQIASEFAIRCVMKAVKRKQPLRILEVGAGIGTLTVALFNACLFVDDHVPEIFYVEDDPTCLEALKRNVPPTWYRMLRRFDITDGVDPCIEPFDLVIIDGEDPANVVPYCCGRRALVVVEGNRRGQRAELELFQYAPPAALHLKPWDRSKGVWLYQLHATPRERLVFAIRQLWQHVLDAGYVAICKVCGRPAALGKKRES